jgi:trans-aconitate 2-methyltransferase
MTHTWDPDRYLTYADERGRPFLELIARIEASPRTVVDLGCGPGNLTELLCQRWPHAAVNGFDASPEMIEKARARGGSAHYDVLDLRDWAPDEPVDVLVSNATLQWLPGHLDLLPTLVAGVRPGGWLAFQVPGNFAEPSHTLRTELAAEPPYAEHLVGVDELSAYDAATYLRALRQYGEVDAWETTYLHVLSGPDPVFEWVLGTSARPTLQALPEGLREQFADEFKRRLRAAYPDDGAGVLMPFRRVFVVMRLSS